MLGITIIGDTKYKIMIILYEFPMIMGMIRYWTYRNMKTLGNYYNDAINFVLIVISGLGVVWKRFQLDLDVD